MYVVRSAAVGGIVGEMELKDAGRGASGGTHFVSRSTRQGHPLNVYYAENGELNEREQSKSSSRLCR